MSSGSFSFANFSMMRRTSSCLVLYLLSSSATLQLWQSVCLSPQSLQAADSWSSFLHSARFALCGSVSLAALRANFICAEGKDCVVFAHTAAALASTVRKSFPWCSREMLCCSRLSTSSVCSFALALLATALPDAPGSAARHFGQLGRDGT